MPIIGAAKALGKAVNEIHWPPYNESALEASKLTHPSNWQKSVSHDTFILTDQLGCPSLQKGEEGRLPPCLSLSLTLSSPPHLNS